MNMPSDGGSPDPALPGCDPAEDTEPRPGQPSPLDSDEQAESSGDTDDGDHYVPL